MFNLNKNSSLISSLGVIKYVLKLSEAYNPGIEKE